ncbi:predicted protein, partial [Naegleria gruberi]
GLFASSIFIGGLFGCLFAMFTGSVLGRKLSIILSCLISIIGSIGAAASYQYSTLIVFRCILGFGSGIVTAVSSVYVVELMPFPKYMGLLGSMFNLGISLGTCWGYAFGAIFVRSSEMWRAVHAFHNLFIIPLFVLVVFIIPESPLFIHGGHHDHEEELKQKHQQKMDESKVGIANQNAANPTENRPVVEGNTDEEQIKTLPHVCSAYVNNDAIDDSEVLEREQDAADIETQQDESPIDEQERPKLQQEQPSGEANTEIEMPVITEEPPIKKKTMSTIAACKRLFCSKVIKALIIACWGCFAMEWTGIQSSVMFLPSLIEAAGVSDPLGQQLASLGVSVWQLFCIFPTMFLVDKFGRKPLMIFGFTVSFLTDLAEGFIFQFGENGQVYKVALALLFNCLYLIGFHVGVGSLGYVLAYEVFRGENEKVVVLGTSISTIAMWSTSIILSLFFIPVVVMTNQAVPWFIFAGFSFIGIIIYSTLLEETSPNIIAKRAVAKAKKEAEKKAISVAGVENVQTKEEETQNGNVENDTKDIQLTESKDA